MAHEIAHISRCRLCNKKFAGPEALLIVPGAALGADVTRVVNYVNKLCHHIITEHADANEGFQMQSIQHLTMLRLLNFETKDPQLLDQINFIRWQTHQATLQAKITDAELAPRVQLLANELAATLTPQSLGDLHTSLGERFAKLLMEAFTAIRDHYEEAGKFKVDFPAEIGPGKAS